MSKKSVKIQHLLASQLPTYVREDFPLIDEFFSQYYLGLEFQGGTLDLISNIDQYIKLNESANVAHETLLAADVNAEQDFIDVYNADGFPETFGIIQIDDEIIVYQIKVGNRFLFCSRGFSGVTSFENSGTEEAVFSDTEADAHTFRSTVKNLSSLFLSEFLKKLKNQILPGLQTQSLPDELNQATFIRQSRDFYSTRGTESSFKILFKALYNVEAEIIRPQDFLISPSNAFYQLTRDLIVEPLEGNPEDLKNMTLFQDKFENIERAYAPISHVERISVGVLTDVYYKVSIDSSFSGFDGSSELLVGNFSSHAKTKIIDNVSVGQTYIDVDSTVGFPKSGELSVQFSDTTLGVVTYTDKSINQFLGISTGSVIKTITDKTPIDQNTYAYGYDINTKTNDGIKVKIRSVLNDFKIPSESYYQTKDSRVKIKSLGKLSSTEKANNWIVNNTPFYDVDTLTVEESSNNIYKLVLKDVHYFRIGDVIELITKNLTPIPNDLVIIDVTGEKECLIRGQGVGDVNNITKVSKRITKFKSDLFADLTEINANVQNIYVDEDKVLVASNSLPAFLNTKVGPNRQKFNIGGTFTLGQEIIPVNAGIDHNLFTGDVIYYTPEKTITEIVQPDGSIIFNQEVGSFLFPEGRYVVKRIDNNNIKFAKSASNLYAGKFESVTPVGGVNTVEIIDNFIEKYEFIGKEVKAQKIFREIKNPAFGSPESKNNLTYSGILINGVEILNYKSSDFVYYGGLTSVDVTAGGSDYDIINPPRISVTDSVGSGATGICAVRGGLKEIKILDPGIGYVETPSIKISGGNGNGAKAEVNLVAVQNEVPFNAVGLSSIVTGIGSVTFSSTDASIGFTTYHKFANGERVVYKTFGEKGITGLSTDSVYHVAVQNPFQVKLHNNIGDAIAGVNTVGLTNPGEGTHKLRSLVDKLKIGSINVTDSGIGYENKERTCGPAGINTALNVINILNHGYKSGEIVSYTPKGTAVGGLSSTNYYVTSINENQIKLSEVGIGTTVSKDFYLKSNQFINLTTIGVGTHSFNYPPIQVEVIGKVGIASTSGVDFKAIVEPVFRGEITSVQLTAAGVGYGVSDIINFKREPNLELNSGKDGQLEAVISADGKIQDVVVNRPGHGYNSPPNIIVKGTGRGAEIVPHIVDGRIVGVKLNKSGIGYGTSTTTIEVVASGKDAKFSFNLQQWTINRVKKGLEKLTSDDVFISESINDDYGLQFSYAYAPRELRKIVYAKASDGSTIYGAKDLEIRDNQEVTNTQHSGILGWSYDGYPIYGPYGYSSVTGGSIVQMKSGYVIDLKSNRPSINDFPQEFFLEDFKWVASTDESVLDKNNGRFCVTPDFPNGTYAYFATFDTELSGDGIFKNLKAPAFPYLIGESFRSEPNSFNYALNSNQDNYDLNASSWKRNVTPYSLNQDNSGYEYLPESYKFVSQDSIIKAIEKGYIDNIGISTGGSGYKVNDRVVFDKEDGFFSATRVSKVGGKGVTQIGFAKSSIDHVEFHPAIGGRSFIGITSSPHNLNDGDVINVSGLTTTSSLLEGSYSIGISTFRLRVSTAIATDFFTGLTTFINVKGADLEFPQIQENDILAIGVGTQRETVKVLNIDKASNRLRILRAQNGLFGVGHTISTQIVEQPRRFTINVGTNTSYTNRRDREYYFAPSESLGLGATATSGAGTTVFINNPGAGVTSRFVLTQQVFLPNHGLITGDELVYNSNGGTPIGVGTTSGQLTAQQLIDGQSVFVANIGEDFIGLSTVRVGLGSTGVFAGIGSTVSNFGLFFFHNVGVGNTHSLRTKFDIIKGNIDRDLVTVTTGSEFHGLAKGDTVYVDVNPSISTTQIVRYNTNNRKTVINKVGYGTVGVSATTNTLNIPSHGLVTGQKVVHKAITTINGIENEKEYFVYVTDNDNIKLCPDKYQTKQNIPNFIDIQEQGAGELFPINPPLTFYRNSTVTFDLTDASLSYSISKTQFPGFVFKLYEDSSFTKEFLSSGDSSKFDVVKVGKSGISPASLTLTVDQNTPKVLYYRLEPIDIDGNPASNLEAVISGDVDFNNQIFVRDSLYDGTHKISGVTTNTFTYSLNQEPERSSYTSSTSDLSYVTDSLVASGPIKAFELKDRRKGYSRLPGISTITTTAGTGAVLVPSSKTIGKVSNTKLENIGFDYSSDNTLRPDAKLPQILEVQTFFRFKSVGITSFGKGYTVPPELIVLDGTSKQMVDDIELIYSLGNTNVEIRKNSQTLSNQTPIIRPIENPNGILVGDMEYDSTEKTVTVTLKNSYSENFPISVGDKVMVENVAVTAPTNTPAGNIVKGFNSSEYDYELFTIDQVTENLGGGLGIVTYSFDKTKSTETIGNFDVEYSSAVLVPEKYFPQFDFVVESNSFQKGNIVKSGDSSGVVANWDSTHQLLTVETNKDFSVGSIVEEDITGSKATILNVSEFISEYDVDYFSLVDNGWRGENGFLNKVEQRLPDNDYYQNFSYSIKSKIPFDTWDDFVSPLVHSAGFKKFSDLQIESELPEEEEETLIPGSIDETTVEIDLISSYDLECVSNFDYATENNIGTTTNPLSDEITFKTRIISDFIESIGNRVLLIDDISPEFDSNQRSTPFESVARQKVANGVSAKFIVLVKDRTFTGERMLSQVTVLINESTGQAMLSQYGDIDTQLDLGSFDYVLEGNEGILNFYPEKFERNNYNLSVFSYNMDQLGFNTISIGAGVAKTVGVSTASDFPGGLIAIAATNHRVVGSGVTTVFTLSGIGTSKSNHRAAKIIFSIENSEGSAEFDELSIVSVGNSVQTLEYNQLTIHSVDSFQGTGLGTYEAVKSSDDIVVRYYPNAGIDTTYINAMAIGLSTEGYVGLGTFTYTNAQLKSAGRSISASASPSAVDFMEYGDSTDVGLDGAYGVLLVTDTTNNIAQLSEFMMIDNDSTINISEFAVIDTTNNQSAVGLGTIGATRQSNSTVLNFTPTANIDVTVKAFLNPLSVVQLVEEPSETEFNCASLESEFDTYTGTKNSIRRSFNLTHKQKEIFRRQFDGSDPGIANTLTSTINIPDHFFVTGQALEYSTTLGIKTDFIGIAQTDGFAYIGIAQTTMLPKDVFCIKVDSNTIKVATSATDALAKNPVSIAFTGNGIGANHFFTAKDANQKVMLSIDNMIQSPIGDSKIQTTLAKAADVVEDTITITGITSFFAGDYVRVGAADTGEIMKIISVGVGTTNALKVERSWVGTTLQPHISGSTVTNLRGNYNIVGNTVHFVEAPHGLQPIASTTNAPSYRDWIGITTSSSFSGRSFMRNSAVGTKQETYARNFLFDDIADQFTGFKKDFRLTTNDGDDVTGISTSTLILINGIYQGIGQDYNYTTEEVSGITTVSFVGTAASTSTDVNTANIPVGGIIVSVASTEGFGYQPLVAAGGTAIIGAGGTIESISVGNTGSGYRSGVGTVFVGVGTSSRGTPNIVSIGTAIIENGTVVSVAVTNSDAAGFTNDNLPYVVIDPPLSYVNIPLVYAEGTSGNGSSATVDIVVGQGSSVIDFSLSNTGFGYGNGDQLTIGIGGTVGIPTDGTLGDAFRNFIITIDQTERDNFNGWSVGDFEIIDNVSNLFNGARTRFPIKIDGEFVSFVAKPGSEINIQDNCFIFVNDVLQVPGVGYEFSGGSQINFTEPPKEGDTFKFIFYKGSAGVDTLTVDITETVKTGDSLTLTSRDLALHENERTVTEIISTNVAGTNPYPGPGLAKDSDFERTIDWCRQRDDVFINGKVISKARALYEPNIFPVANIIHSIGIGSTEIYVDNAQPIFNHKNESTVTPDFQKQITIVNLKQKVGASATAIVGTSGTVTEIVLSDGGVGYTTAPVVTIQTPVGLGTTQKATATAILTGDTVTSVAIGTGGTQYSQTSPPVVLIEPPSSMTEKIDIEDNTIISFSGDYGVVTGFGTTSGITRDGIVGLASTAVFFDLLIERDSTLREKSQVIDQVVLSGLSTGDFFTIYDSNINPDLGVGVGLTALMGGEDHNQTVVGVGTTFADGIYRVAHHIGVSTGGIGYGITECRRVFVSVVNNSNVGFGTSSFFGRFSWGKMLCSERVGVNSFSAINNNGVVGIKTGPYVIRQIPMKSIGFVP